MEPMAWVTLTKTFIADSAYTNVIIGSFKTNSSASASIMPYHVISPGLGDSSAYYYIDSVALEQVLPSASVQVIAGNSAMQLSPNPFSEYTTLTFDNETHNPYTLVIYDLNGRPVRKMDNITSGEIRIEKGNLESGFYYFKLYGANDKVGTGRFVIKE
jgi:hypothetical protein